MHSLLSSLNTSIKSIAETTKQKTHTLHEYASKAVEKTSHTLTQASLSLQQLDCIVPQQLEADKIGITYITKRLMIMKCPVDEVQGDASNVAPPANLLTTTRLASFLHRHYQDCFMVWNLSEKNYNYEALDNQVIEFRFPGYPAPPLSQIFSLCNSIKCWLDADNSNIALVHCQTGQGRSITTLAWYLTWSGEFATVEKALAYVISRFNLPLDLLLIPTQERYLSYLSKMLHGFKPHSCAVRLERIIMSSIPKLSDPAWLQKGEARACRPYLQIFKDAKLIYTDTGRDSTQLRWYTSKDTSILFPINLTLQGDILVRVRHLSSSNQRLSLLRFGFHTSFLPGNNLRLTKADLDGATHDQRFDEDFVMDLFFTPIKEKEPETEEQRLFWEQVHSARKQAAQAQSEGASSTNSASSTPTASPIDFSKFKLPFRFGGGEENKNEEEVKVDPAERKRKKKLATEKAVAAALATSPQPVHTSASASPQAPLDTSFNDLAEYVANINNKSKDEDMEELRRMEQELEEATISTPQPAAKSAATTSNTQPSPAATSHDIDLLTFATPAHTTNVTSTASSPASPPATLPDSSSLPADLLSPQSAAINAALEQELAELAADLGELEDNGEEVVLDEAAEADMLAMLQEEMEQKNSS